MALVLQLARCYRAFSTRSTERFGFCLCLCNPRQECYPGGLCSAAACTRPWSIDSTKHYEGSQEQLRGFSGWWANRLCKECPLYVDFKHKVSGDCRWFGIQQRHLHVGCERMQESLSAGSSLRDKELWSLSEAGDLDGALDVLLCMDQQGSIPTVKAYNALLKACARRKAVAEAKRVTAHLTQHGLDSIRVIGESVVIMLVDCGCLEDGFLSFYRLPHRTVYSWTAVISGYCAVGQFQEALRMYQGMLEEGVKPDSYTFVELLKASRSLSDVKWIQAEAVKYRCESDSFVATSLVDMYLKYESMRDAQDVFYGLRHPNVMVYTAMLVTYVQQRQAGKALQLYENLRNEGITPNAQTLMSALQACGMLAAKEKGVSFDEGWAKENSLEQGKRLHADAWSKGCDSNVFVGSGLISMYAKCGSILDARSVFDGLFKQNLVSWNAMLAAYVHQGEAGKALKLYEQMRQEGTSPNNRTFVSVLQAYGILALKEEAVVTVGLSTKAWCLEKGKGLHAEARREGQSTDVFVCNTLISMYRKCGSIGDARNVFDELVERSVVSWNAMITAYVEQGEALKALHLYDQMQSEGVSPNDRSFVSALQACAMLAESEGNVLEDEAPMELKKSLEKGKEIHAVAQMNAYVSDVFVGNTLISMYGKCGCVVDALYVFDGLHKRDVVSWNAMLATYTQQGQAEMALQLYERMWQEGVSPDDRSFVAALQACGIAAEQERSAVVDGRSTKLFLEKGRAIHADAQRKGYVSDVFVVSTLISMYAKCGSIVDAQRMFDGLSQRDVVSWNAMIVAYAQQGQADKAWETYEQMQEEGIRPDEVTVVCILQACSHTGNLDVCRRIHHTLFATQSSFSPRLANTLIHAYGRCASMVEAQSLFDVLPQPDVVSWTALIAGYAQQGDFAASLRSYEDMQRSGVMPDGVTFLSLLSACSHAGLVDRGVEYFECMTKHHGIVPGIEHYVTMVDLLGRAGYFTSIEHLLSSMRIPASLPLLSCLLGACRKHGKVVLGKQVFDCTLSLQPQDSSAYVLMSNLYSDAGLFNHAREVKELRQIAGAWKKPGQSWIRHEHEVRTFGVGDQNHQLQQRLLDLLVMVSLGLGKEASNVFSSVCPKVRNAVA